MANYPNADPNFPSRSNGQTIDASHVQGLQDEVTAIGAALRGTLAHGVTVGSTYSLNVAGGNSTLGGALQVNGNSTIAGGLQSSNSTIANLTVSGGSTFTGAVTFNTTPTANSTCHVQLRPVACRVAHSAITAVASGAWVSMSWDTERFDTDGMHSTAANSSRVNILSTGTYLIGAHIQWNQVSSNGTELRVLVNDTTTIGHVRDFGGGTAGLIQNLVTTWRFDSTTDYVSLSVLHALGSSGSVAVTANVSPEFWVTKVIG